MALKYWQIVQLSYAETHAKFASADSQEVSIGGGPLPRARATVIGFGRVDEERVVC